MSCSVSQSLPSHSQVPYTQPNIPNLLSLASYLYLLSCTSSLASAITNAPLLGPLITAILLGPDLGGLLSPAMQDTLINLGYTGLILIVFEAGLTTHIPLLVANAALSTVVALTGVALPIALSMAMFKGAWGYGALQAFAAGAALCSTSLGTTIALLTPELRTTRVGSVLMAAALLDDVIGLVIAGIISGLAGAGSGVKWEEIVKPLLVSLAFGLGTPLLAVAFKRALRLNWLRLLPKTWVKQSCDIPSKRTSPGYFVLQNNRVQLFFIVLTLSAFVAGSSYAGTSDLFGAYLAGTFLSYIFSTAQLNHSVPEGNDRFPEATLTNSTLHAFELYLSPVLHPLLEPIFFASIGASIPIKSLFTAYSGDGGPEDASHRVVWRGLLYALLMVIGKMAVGFWFLVWPNPGFWSRSVSRLCQVLKKQSRKCIDVLAIFMSKFNLSRGRREQSNSHQNSSSPAFDIALNSREPSEVANISPVKTVEGPQSEKALTNATSSQQPSDWIPDNASHPEPSNATKGTSEDRRHEETEAVNSISPRQEELTRTRGALLLGIAMVARGEIALIVAQLARPLLLGTSTPGDDSGMDEEPFAIVMWAILISTFGGAVGVGLLLRAWQRRDKTRSSRELNPTRG